VLEDLRRAVPCSSRRARQARFDAAQSLGHPLVPDLVDAHALDVQYGTGLYHALLLRQRMYELERNE